MTLTPGIEREWGGGNSPFYPRDGTGWVCGGPRVCDLTGDTQPSLSVGWLPLGSALTVLEKPVKKFHQMVRHSSTLL